MNANPLECPPHITPPHWQEWRDSGVADEIIELNVQSREGDVAYEYLCYSEDIKRRNDGRLTNFWLRRYEHCTEGGLWCSGRDPLNNWEPMTWGAFKPDKPIVRLEREYKGFWEPPKLKTVKYEHPAKTPTRAFFLAVSRRIWQAIADRHGIPTPDLTAIPDDQIPAEFWRWVRENPSVPVIVVEGAKKAACLLSNGHVAIALPGIFNGYRQPKDRKGNKSGDAHLIPELEVICQKGRQILICFDHDLKPKTVSNVRLAIARTGKLLQKTGCVVKVINLPGPEKGVDDFIVARGGEAWEEVYKAAVDLREWGVFGYLLTYTPNIERNDDRLCFNIFDSPKLVAIRSPKGTGKSFWLRQQAKKAYEQGIPVIVLTHRRQLGRKLARELGLLYKDDVPESCTWERWANGYVLCIDSAHPGASVPFRAEDWKDALIIIDESESVLWHLLNSQTCQKNRVPILTEIQKLLTLALSPKTRGQVILADADQSDVTIDFVKNIAGQPDLKPFVVVNYYKFKGYKCLSYPAPTALRAKMMAEIATGKHLVCSTGQKATSKTGTQALEAEARRRYPDRKIVRIDAETVADPKHPAYGCLSSDFDFDEFLKRWDIVIVSPVCESGISIDLYDHFSAVWGFLSGVIPANVARQFLGRVRDNAVPRHIYAPTRAINSAFIGKGETNVDKLLKSQTRQARFIISQLTEWGITADEEKITKFCPEGLNSWAQMATRINRDNHHYRGAIHAGLREEGHSVEVVGGLDPETHKQVSEEMKAVSDSLEEAEAQDITNTAPPPDLHAYTELKRSPAKTKTERHSVRHYELEEKYLVPVDPEMIKRDNRGWYRKLLIHYFLTAGKEHLNYRDAKRIKAISSPDGMAWMPDVLKKSLTHIIHSLRALEFDKFLALAIAGEGFSSDHPLIKAMVEKATQCSAQVREVLGISPQSGKSNMRFIQDVLGSLMGIRLKPRKQRGADGAVGPRTYYWEPPNDGRDEIFRAWLKRDELLAQLRKFDDLDTPTPEQVKQPVGASTGGNHSSVAKNDPPQPININKDSGGSAQTGGSFSTATSIPPSPPVQGRATPEKIAQAQASLFSPEWVPRPGEVVVCVDTGQVGRIESCNESEFEATVAGSWGRITACIANLRLIRGQTVPPVTDPWEVS